MRIAADEALARLAAHDHGILCTLHPERGADAVPVVYAVDGDHLGVPIDRIKPKASPRLQRERNLEADPRATLLVEHWDRTDWSTLWWVRAELRLVAVESLETDESAGDGSGGVGLAERLVERYPQYHDRPFERLLVLRIHAVTGWSASQV